MSICAPTIEPTVGTSLTDLLSLPEAFLRCCGSPLPGCFPPPTSHCVCLCIMCLVLTVQFATPLKYLIPEGSIWSILKIRFLDTTFLGRFSYSLDSEQMIPSSFVIYCISTPNILVASQIPFQFFHFQEFTERKDDQSDPPRVTKPSIFLSNLKQSDGDQGIKIYVQECPSQHYLKLEILYMPSDRGMFI